MDDAVFLKLCQAGTPEEVERAIRAGANVNAADEDDWTALHFAILFNDAPEVARMLLENGANVNAKDDNGDTPLMNAVMGESPKLILLLLDGGADVSMKNDDGHTAADMLPKSTPKGVNEKEWEAIIKRLKGTD
jgi:ankyrin repeat protein